ncbi:hypothetical protein B0J13DRAFT_105528 [Dactylonectria estremocensis]|uniref:Uncharacterized protein n=1 Tax=Dactylonectria estremocensis TaxID=1079267 RepID=A0A9P9E5X4_9HYPO|nr:hypothetical protein B0J13DRAFT_105528 [Dactylonectria estremocensis]
MRKGKTRSCRSMMYGAVTPGRLVLRRDSGDGVVFFFSLFTLEAVASLPRWFMSLGFSQTLETKEQNVLITTFVEGTSFKLDGGMAETFAWSGSKIIYLFSLLLPFYDEQGQISVAKWNWKAGVVKIRVIGWLHSQTRRRKRTQYVWKTAELA